MARGMELLLKVGSQVTEKVAAEPSSAASGSYFQYAPNGRRGTPSRRHCRRPQEPITGWEPREPSCGQERSPTDPIGAPHARYSELERLDQRQNAGGHHCCIRSRPCHPHGGTVEHRACCEQSRTERNTGIDDGGSDPAASRRAFRDYHGSRALTRCRHRMVRGTWLGGRAGIAGEGTASYPPTLEYRFPIE